MPLGRGHAAEVGLVPHPAGLGERELAEEEERRARRRGDPVRVAPTGVEQGVVVDDRAAVGQIEELGLQLERAQLLEQTFLLPGDVPKRGR